jgi:hypothetical protein
MSRSQMLTLLWTPWSLTFSLAVLLVAAAFCWVAWRRSGWHRGVGGLEAVRFSAVLVGVWMLNQPEWVQEFHPQERPSIAVLWDASPSMQTRDVIARDQPGSPLRSRSEAIQSLTEATFWRELSDQLDVRVQAFPGEGEAATTDLYGPLAQLAGQETNLRGVVLLSDGDWNEGPPPIEAASRLRLRGVPVFVVPVGSAVRLPDVELLSLDAPTFGVVGKAVRVPFTINSSMPRDYDTTVTLKTSDGETVTKEVRVAPMGRTNQFIEWKPESIGDYTVTLTVPLHPEETLPDNNELTAPIAIRQEQLRVLLVESTPRWEYRYLRNALSRDPGVQLSCLLLHPGLSKVGGGSSDYIKSFPSGLDELGQYDVVFLGDVGIEDGQLTAEQCRLLRGVVEHQASGLVFMPGLHGRQLSLLDSELDDLYPVTLDAAQPGGWGSRTPSQFALTETGRRSLLTRLADTQEENLEVWEGLPGFQWYAPVLRARAGSEVLCVHKDVANQYGRLPLVATRTFGAGKVLFMGTDGAWRWRKGVEDRYHYRFWGQVVRWMAYARNMAKGETMRLYHAPDQPQLRQNVVLRATVMDHGGEPVQRGDVTARIVAPSGRGQSIRLTSTGEEWGAYTATYAAAEPGEHRVTLACAQTEATLESTFFVHGELAERIGQPARPEVLEEIARITCGRVLDVDQLDNVVQAVTALPQPPATLRRVQLWSHPLMVAMLTGLLGVFWVGRKMVGLI